MKYFMLYHNENEFVISFIIYFFIKLSFKVPNYLHPYKTILLLYFKFYNSIIISS